jgi:hypothetical protein
MRRCSVPIRPWVSPLGPTRTFQHFQRPSSVTATVRSVRRRPWALQNKNGGTCFFATSTMPSLLTNGDPTIYALSTSPGRAAIAVIRVSGPACMQVGYVCNKPSTQEPFNPDRRVPIRYIELCAPEHLCFDRALLHYAHYTIRLRSHRETRSSMPALSSFIFPLHGR